MSMYTTIHLVRMFCCTPLSDGPAIAVSQVAPRPGNGCRDANGRKSGNADLSGEVPVRKPLHPVALTHLPGNTGDEVPTRPSRCSRWYDAESVIPDRRIHSVDFRVTAAGSFPSDRNPVLSYQQRASHRTGNIPTTLSYVHLGAAGVCALRRTVLPACTPWLRRSSLLSISHLFRRFLHEEQMPALLNLGSSTQAHTPDPPPQHGFPALASRHSSWHPPSERHISMRAKSATVFASKRLNPGGPTEPATGSSQHGAHPIVPDFGSDYRSPRSSKSSPTRWWLNKRCASLPPRHAVAAVFHSLGVTNIAQAADSNTSGFSGCIRKATTFDASTHLGAAPTQPPSVLHFSTAAPAIPCCRRSLTVAAIRSMDPSHERKRSQPRTYSTATAHQFPEPDKRQTRPIRKLLIANRGEIAIRIHRACKEMGIRSVGIFSPDDALALHRQVCDESYRLTADLSPVGVYLNYPEIIEIALKHNVDAIHPGYGFLSENPDFAAAVEEAGIMLVGPSPRVLAMMGDKLQARIAAARAGVQSVPGTNAPIRSFEEASAIAEKIGYPVMLKAAHGGGGRGMRRVLQKDGLQEGFERAMSEAKAAFGDGALFLEKSIERGIHIEVQILADHYGDVVHLRERDCTVQRRHQKVIEIAPAPFLDSCVLRSILNDAVQLMRSVGYQNAGTVEFLVERHESDEFTRLIAHPQTTKSASNRRADDIEAGGGPCRSDDASFGASRDTQNQRRGSALRTSHQALDNGSEAAGSEEERELPGTGENRKHEELTAYFIEVNPRLQVEHTVSEEITGIDIVKAQIALREGASLKELGITQSRIDAACSSEGPFALQCRITTEDSQRNFQPSTGRIELYQPSTGPGIRLDGAIGASGAVITSHYDSLLVKVIAKGGTFLEAVRRARRALRETKIRGVTTNIPFILNVLQNPDFLNGKATTHFVDDHQMLLYYDPVDLSSQNICKYLAQIAVNGPLTQLVRADAEPERKPVSPPPLPAAGAAAAAAVVSGGGSLASPTHDVDIQHLASLAQGAPRGMRALLRELGPAGFVQKLRQQKNVLLCDTTLRDAHQSLLATRLRTYDMVKAAPAYSYLFPMLFSLENWGGATFDVAYRFLRESPWRRLQLLREAIPNIPFQMLLRGANAVGYTAYADNVVEKFCAESVAYGIDIFRVFDSLNYVENLKHGIHAAGAAGGVVEAAMVYTGDVGDPKRRPYTLEYYLDLARRLVATNCHILCIKDMAGLLTPTATKLLVGSLREEFPDMPIHVHTHDTAGCGVASMIAAAEAGADVVDVAIDALAGLTSQPPMGAVVSALRHTHLDPGIDLKAISTLNDYFEGVRLYYAPFEATATLKSVSCDVYENEIPGGQYTNLHMQAFSLGLADQWPRIKAAYVAASRLLGNPPKVTPTSKVVGDLAQFMVQNNLDEAAVQAQADVLSFPISVVQYLQGCLGQPPFGFPEPLRTKVLGGKKPIEGRPGAFLEKVNWAEVRQRLEETHGRKFREADLLSSVLYPEVFDDFQRFLKSYGDVSMLPTPQFFKGVLPGESITVHMAGREVNIKYIAQTHVHPDGTRDVYFNVMGLPRAVNVSDTKAVKVDANRKADPTNPKQIGSPMPGNVLQVTVRRGQGVQKGQQVAVISAMKMETAVVAPVEGIVGEVYVNSGDAVQQGDLLMELQ